MTRDAVCEKWNASAGFVSSRRKLVERDVPPDDPIDDGESARVDLGPDGGTFSNVKSDTPITDWDFVFKKFNLDPDAFEIIGDSVRMSMWQQSKRTENGDRDVINLYSYRAQFRRKVVGGLTDEELGDYRSLVSNWRLPRLERGASGTPSAVVLNMSDFQLFKGEGGGVQATLARIYAGLADFQEKISRLRKFHNVNEIVLVNNGDPFEGIAGNYANQTFTVQGGLRSQMNLVLDVWLSFARELFPQFEKAQFVSVLCNHTEFGRQGGAKNSITSDSDNGSAFLAETLRRILDGRDEFNHVKYTIPNDEMNVYTKAAGVKLGFNHGHKIPGNDAGGFEKWLNGQARGDQKANEAEIWVTAHRHNYQAWDLGSTFAFSTPSCDGGSKWLRDTTGKHARSGMISFLVDPDEQMRWSNVNFH